MTYNNKVNDIYDFEKFKAFFKKIPVNIEQPNKPINKLFFNEVLKKNNLDRNAERILPTKLNIFEGFGLGENELKHCSVLAWFLDPGANHCQGELFFNTLLEEIGDEQLKENTEGGYFTVSTEDQFSDFGRVDIIISNNNFIYIIEAKINAPDQEHQIERYKNILKQKSETQNIPEEKCKLIYLSNKEKISHEIEAHVYISWRQISNILIKFSNEQCENNFVASIANQYSEYIKHNLRDNDG